MSGGKTGLSLLLTTAPMWRVGRGPRGQQNLGVRRQDWIVIADDYCSDVESRSRPLETAESLSQEARLGMVEKCPGRSSVGCALSW